ncbi:hypothetical protein [Hamadaea tsunoensis]|uniref:hypothetical protein n=1 Tax=Hamadaea tsunoensis TaxID=53368 RepID=UPI00042423B7|nr:hypothetical protein [Hamadaea tsunoensis]
MTEQVRADLAAALADDAADAPLRVLRLAFELAAPTLSAAGSDGGVTAIEAVIALDEAFSAAAPVLAAAPALLDAAAAGSAVDDYVRGTATDVATLAGRLAATRSEWEDVRRSEEDLRARAAEHEELLVRVHELRRLARLVTALDELAAQRALVDERLELLRGTAGVAVEGLSAAAGDLVTLTGERLDLLAAPAREALAEAAERQARLAELEARLTTARAGLAAATARQAALTAEHDQTVAALREHEAADRAVAAALAAFGPAAETDALARLTTVLDEVRGRLTEVDGALGAHLAAAAARHDGTAAGRALSA